MLILYYASLYSTFYGMYKPILKEDEVEVVINCGTHLVKAIAKKPKPAAPRTLYSDQHLHDDIRREYISEQEYADSIRSFLYAAEKNDQQTMRNMLIRCPALVNSMLRGKSALHIATKLGNLAEVNMLLSYGADVNISSQEDSFSYKTICETPLHIAAARGDDKVIMALLSRNADVEIYDQNHETALHLAIKNGHASTVNLLLEHGASATALAAQDKTSLHIAAENNHLQLFDLFSQYGININAQDREQRTPLYLAVAANHLGMVNAILAHQPDIDACDLARITPLFVAVDKGNHAMAQVLLGYQANPNATDTNRETPLHIAARHNDIDMVALLIKCGANAEVRATGGHTPLLAGAKYEEYWYRKDVEESSKKLHVAQLLLEHGASPHAIDNFGRNALFYAIFNNHSSMIELLVRYNADLDDCAGFTSLHIAAELNCIEVVPTLLKLGAKICDRDQDFRQSGLALAVCKDNRQIVKLLLDSSHDPMLANNYLEGLLLAADNKHLDIMRLFFEHGGYLYAQKWKERLGQSLQEAVDRSNYDVVSMYLKYDIPLPRNILHKAIEANKVDIVRTLVLHKQVDLAGEAGLLGSYRALAINIRNFLTVTFPATLGLVQAIDQGNYDEFIKHLKSHADLTYKDKQGNTPLHHAVMHGRLKMIKDLLMNNADPVEQNYEGTTSISYAASNPSCLGIFMHAAIPQNIVERRLAINKSEKIFEHVVQLDRLVVQETRLMEEIRRQARPIGTTLTVLAGLGLGAIGLRQISNISKVSESVTCTALLAGVTTVLCKFLYGYLPTKINQIRLPEYLHHDHLTSMSVDGASITSRLFIPNKMRLLIRQIDGENRMITMNANDLHDKAPKDTHSYIQEKITELIHTHSLATVYAQDKLRQIRLLFN